MFWQGGFTFYSAIVVPVGRGLDAFHQSLVTQRVTHYLNAAGVVAVIVLVWEGMAAADSSTGRRRWRWGLVAVMGVGMAILIPLHFHLDTYMASGVERE